MYPLAQWWTKWSTPHDMNNMLITILVSLAFWMHLKLFAELYTQEWNSYVTEHAHIYLIKSGQIAFYNVSLGFKLLHDLGIFISQLNFPFPQSFYFIVNYVTSKQYTARFKIQTESNKLSKTMNCCQHLVVTYNGK